MQTKEYRRLARLSSTYNRKSERIGQFQTTWPFELEWVERGSDRCAYCGVGLEIGRGTFDHKIPLDKGGPNRPLNIVRCCYDCQRRKGTKTPAEFEAHKKLIVACGVCGKEYQPRWAEYTNGRARVCSRSCSARRRWQRCAS